MAQEITRTSQARQIIGQLLEFPELAAFVRELEPGILYQLIRRCGLEETGEILALATADQLAQIFDQDLWKTEESGSEDSFDSERFGLWLEVLAEAGPGAAAGKIAGMEFDFVTGAVCQHVLILGPEWSRFLRGDVEEPEFVDCPGEERFPGEMASLMESGLTHEFCGYTVISKSGQSWDALIAILIELEERHPDFFGRFLNRCAQISAESMLGAGDLGDGPPAVERVMADAAFARESRREEAGYVAPLEAAAFLRNARHFRPEKERVPPNPDPVTLLHLANARKRSEKEIAHRERAEQNRAEPDRRVSQFIEMLRIGDVLPPERSSLLLPAAATSGADRLSRFRQRISQLREVDEPAYRRRMNELGYLANVLMAGCSHQSRRLRASEAADAVLAVCNLGLENWPPAWIQEGSTPRTSGLPHDFLSRQELTAVFKIGWRRIYEKVTMAAAACLSNVLDQLQGDDRETQQDLTQLSRRLRHQIETGTPWLERDRLDVIAILDQPTWSILLGLLDEFPVLPKPSGRGSRGRMPIGTEFVAENSQIVWVDEFLDSLAERLTS